MIKDIARQLLKETINLENNWLTANPGYIMNNYSIKCEAYKYVIENIDTEKQIHDEIKKQQDKCDNMPKGIPHGHYIWLSVYQDILKRLNAQKH